MRHRAIPVASALLLVAAVAAAQSLQVRARTELPPAQAARPSPVLRSPLTSAEKLAAARKLFPAVTGVLDSLTLTARVPYVENQGYLALSDGSFDPGNVSLKLIGRASGKSTLSVWWMTPDPSARFLVDIEIKARDAYASKQLEVWLDGSRNLVEPAKETRHLTYVIEGNGANQHTVALRAATNGDNYVLAAEITRLK
jgi:hypothetical protein